MAAHLALLPALLTAMSAAPVPDVSEPIVVDLTPFPPIPRPQAPAQPSPDPDPGGAATTTPEPEPDPVVTPPAAKAPEPPKPPASPVRARPPVPAPRSVPTLAATAALNRGPAAQPAGPALVSPNLVSVGAGELAGAATAGSGRGGGSGSGAGSGSGSGSGGDCDMIARLQRALRDDPDIRDGLVRARRDLPPGRTPLLWNGNWLRTPGEDGDGLAGVRQAIAVEVAFAPPACRSQPMRGLVLLTLADGPSPPAVALGTGSWRWSDLTGASRR